MKTYSIVFLNNSGSFAVESIAHTVQGSWWNSVQNFNGEHDMAFVDVEDANAEYLEALLDADENVVSYSER